MSRLFIIKIYLFFLLIYILIGGGRIPSSDEVTMYMLTQSIVDRHDFSVSKGNVVVGEDGRTYAKAGIGQAILAVPLYAVAKSAAHFVPDPFKTLAQRAVVSIFNAFVGAAICVLFFSFCLFLGYTQRVSFWLCVGLGLCTFLTFYNKSFLLEPLRTLCLLGAVYFFFRYTQTHLAGDFFLSGLFCGLGPLVKITFVKNIGIIGLFLCYFLLKQKKAVYWKNTGWFMLPQIVCAIGLLVYNHIIFGSPFASGYSQEGSTDLFSTPLWVGLYGLLVSSGKGFFWYAPIAMLGLFGFNKLHSRFPQLAFLIAAICLFNCLFYAKFVAWAGDGSWGPRYLTPLLPLIILPAGALFTSKISKTLQAWLYGLLLIGALVQVGGISIYFGMYHREIGEYPYQRSFSDPLFLHQSHFIPNYSPIVGHWEMLIRNIAQFSTDGGPRITPLDSDDRLPLTEVQKTRLLYAVDFWFMYAVYAGFPPVLSIIGVATMLIVIVAVGRSIRCDIIATEGRLFI